MRWDLPNMFAHDAQHSVTIEKITVLLWARYSQTQSEAYHFHSVWHDWPTASWRVFNLLNFRMNAFNTGAVEPSVARRLSNICMTLFLKVKKNKMIACKRMKKLIEKITQIYGSNNFYFSLVDGRKWAYPSKESHLVNCGPDLCRLRALRLHWLDCGKQIQTIHPRGQEKNSWPEASCRLSRNLAPWWKARRYHHPHSVNGM